jgi:protein-S-isoprenylcysteine O-methyltransferase Ste14
MALEFSSSSKSRFEAGKFDRGGFYSVFLHPMYTFQILITVPGLILLFNSWLVFAAVIPSFITFKAFAKEEEKYLENKFGAKYKDYREKVLFKYL